MSGLNLMKHGFSTKDSIPWVSTEIWKLFVGVCMCASHNIQYENSSKTNITY